MAIFLLVDAHEDLKYTFPPALKSCASTVWFHQTNNYDEKKESWKQHLDLVPWLFKLIYCILRHHAQFHLNFNQTSGWS